MDTAWLCIVQTMLEYDFLSAEKEGKLWGLVLKPSSSCYLLSHLVAQIVL